MSPPSRRSPCHLRLCAWLQIDMKSKPDGKHARMEKYILRKAFDLAEQPYLPEEVLWRQKEQFSDGVGYDWVDGLRAFAAQVCRTAWAAKCSTRLIGWQVKSAQRDTCEGFFNGLAGSVLAFLGIRWTTFAAMVCKIALADVRAER